MESFSAAPQALLRSLVANRRLIRALAVREIAARYRGSALGFAWAIVQPVFMLGIYAFVFSEVFKARWPGGTGSKAEFALVLFAGLLVFNMFSEVFNRAPQLILGNANYVKRVVFPLEILPCVSVITALFNLVVSLAVWIVFYVVAFGMPHATALLAPIVILPLMIFLTGVSWLFAALGVYLRDITQITAIITTAMMFLTPIFFPVDAIPARFQPILNLNPLAPTVHQIRDVLMFGRGIEPMTYALTMLAAIASLFIGFAFFQKVRKGFADVI
ncbi:ABC transporter permease [Luteibacter sp. 329MFSha]|uniref:ABC transporter permease n=1 Tax=Luteibacter sp. 329MFSha TaxID=1798239 RepID=UPI0008D64364|nr:ABC transporter permease [Luteibacter sp. 329MFSha]SEW16823.1 lipopolysaccharide transport system permease protein [Luteibacter sp. 329MFSha]